MVMTILLKLKCLSHNVFMSMFRQLIVGRRKRRAAKAEQKRNFRKLQDQLMNLEKQAEKYRKRLQRLKKNHPSPRSKVNKLLSDNSDTSLKITLLFHTVVAEEIRSKYASSKRESDRQVIARIFTSKISKKCKLQRLTEEVFGFSRRR